MKTQIEKNFMVEAPADQVWDLLSDPPSVVECVPGATITDTLDDRHYKGKVALKFGPVKASYDGEVVIEQMNPDQREMSLSGKGVDTKGKGSAELAMKGKVASQDGGSSVDFQMEISITGKLAQFGARLISDVTDHLFGEFVENFKAKLAAEPEVATEQAPELGHSAQAPKEENALNGFALIWAVIKGFFTRLFG